jgi:hypothetical protein
MGKLHPQHSNEGMVHNYHPIAKEQVLANGILL